MITLESLTPKLLSSSLASDVCPACGGFKRPHFSLCFKQFSQLPRPLKQNLYLRIGKGYERALHSALSYLGATKFHT